MVSTFPPAVSPRLVGKQNTAGIDCLTFSGPSNSVLASASYAQVVASSAAEYYIVGVAYRGGSGSGYSGQHFIRCQIGIGASGSEVSVAKLSVGCQSVAAGTLVAGTLWIPVPIRVATGTRIAARFEDPLGTATYTADLMVVPYTSVEGN